MTEFDDTNDAPRRVSITEYFKQTPVELIVSPISGIPVDTLPRNVRELEAILAEREKKYPGHNHNQEQVEHILSIIYASDVPDSVVQSLIFSRDEDGTITLCFMLPHPDILYS